MTPEFVWGYEPGDVDEFAALEGDDPDAIKRAVLDVLRIDDLEEVPCSPLAARAEGLGRGAEGPAIAIYIAAATVIIGQVLTWLDAAERVAQFWRWARKRQRPPVLSLGALVMLTAIDLERRLGSVEDVGLIWAGDVGGWAERGDLGYTGEDIYAVLYARAGALWVYVVDDIGQVLHFGQGAQAPHSHLRHIVGDHDPVESAPPEPRSMLLEGDEEETD